MMQYEVVTQHRSESAVHAFPTLAEAEAFARCEARDIGGAVTIYRTREAAIAAGEREAAHWRYVRTIHGG